MINLLPRFSFHIGRSAMLLLMLLLPLLGWGQGSTTVVISQVYGGGGNAAASYQNDFVELHNVSASTVSIAGYVLQYTSSAGTFTAPSGTNSVTLTGSIPAGGYFLIGLAAGGTASPALPATNASNTSVNMAAAAGKVVLSSNNATTGITPVSSNTIDYVGYGTAATTFEGTGPAPVGMSTGNAFSYLRGNNGCTDTNQNSTDFATGTPNPRNAGSAIFSCTAPAATITVMPTSLTGFSTTTGTPSATQTYTVGGTTLTAFITASAPTGYEVALESTTTPSTPGTFAASVNTAAPTSGTVAATTIYVRLTGAATGTPSGDVANSSTTTGATTKNVAVTGTVTAPVAPSVTTTAATGVSTTTATSGGNVTAAGGAAITARGVVYGTTANPRIGGAGVTQVSATGTTGAFTSSLTGLAPGTAYFVAAYATNSVGTTYGTDQTFTTTAAALAPSITTTAASAITSTTATSGGNVTTDGGDAVTARGVVFGTVANPRIGGAGVTQVSATGTTGAFTSSLTGLAPGTAYFVAAYATNGIGTTYGTDQTFTTVGPPSVTTTAATAITASTATSGGNVTVSGGATITARGVVYGTTPNPQIGGAGVTQVTNASPGIGTFTSSLTGLSGGTTYYVAAYATNSAGTTYGANQSFTTPATPLLAFDFQGTNSPTNPVPSSFNNANVAPSSMESIGVSRTSAADRFSNTNWPISASADPTKYVRFSFAPNAGYQATLTSLSFVTQRSSTGPTALEVRSSADGFVAALFTGGPLTGTAANPATAITLSGTAFTNIPAGPGVTFRIYAYGGSATTGTFSVDDVNVFGTVVLDTTPRIAANPATLTFSAITGQVAPTATYTLSAANLAANAAISISSSDAAVLVSLTGGAPFAQTASVMASATGTLSQVVTVQFTAPATAGTTTATISNTDGTNTATVTVTGTATVPPAPAITSFSPNNGPVGMVVTITGTGFVAGTTVAFNGTAATAVTVISATSIQATVPVGTTTGTISVSNANGTATSSGVFTVTVPAAVQAAGLLLLEDDFNYVAGTRLSANGWATHSGASSNDQPTVVASNLTNTTYPTGPLAPDANKVRVNSDGADVNRGFTLPAGSTTVYYSVLLNIPTVDAAATDYFLHLLERNTPGPAQYFRARLFARPGTTAGTYNLGVSLFAAVPPNTGFTAAEYTAGQTYLAVVKYVYKPGGTDAVSLFVFDNATPLPATEPATPSATPVTESNNSFTSLPDGFAIRQASSGSGASLNKTPTVNLDGVRVGTGWGAVVGNPSFTEATATINAGNYYALAVTAAAARLTLNGPVNVEKTLTLTNGLINTTAANLLTTYETATATGGSATSFVNGPLARVTGTGAATTVFPVGKGTFYRPITLASTAQAAASTYTAEQFEGNPSRILASGNGLGTAPLARVSSKRFYTVTSSNTTPGNFTGKITLSFGAEDYVNVPSSTDFVIAKRDATGSFANQWTNLGRFTNTGTDSGAGGPSVAGTLTSAEFSDFSDFVLGAQNDLSNTNVLEAINPLPVELTAFGAQRQADKTVAVKWATATEKNSARFEVQRSLNGREFATIATVAAQGNSTRPTAYATLDKTAPAALLYYRLRQVDLDGTSALSPVVTVTASGAAAKVQLYPNPAHGRISFIAEAATAYRVLNQLGQPLLRGTAEAGTASIILGALPTGLYFLELQTATGRTVQKFEKD